MIELREVTKDYRISNGTTKKALTNINLKFGNKGLVSILGSSGSGKTTLMNLIAGIVKPSSGTIIYETLNSNVIKESDYDYLRNRYFGFVFQDMYLIETLTVYENIEIALKLQGLNDDESKSKITDALVLLNIIELANNKISELSGGEKQRVTIARSIAKGIKVLLADEPASSLDKHNSDIIYGYLKEISKDILVIMVTHDEDSALKVSDRIIRIKKGEISYDSLQDTPDIIQQLPENPKVKKIKLAAQTSKYINRKQRFRYIFTSFFWVSSILAIMLALNFALLKTPNFIYTTNLEVGNTGYKIVDDLFNIDENNFDYQKIDQNKYSSIKFYNYYHTKDFFLGNFSVSSSNILLDDYYGKDVFNTIIYDDMNKFEVEITDFSADMMIYYNIILASNVDSVVGKSFLYNGYELKIVNITKTNYKDYEINHLNSDDDLLYNFKRNRDSAFKNVKMSEETREIILSPDIMTNIHSLSTNITIRKYSNSDIEPYSMYGTIPEKDNEILVSISYLSKLVENPNISNNELDNYINKDYEIGIEFNENLIFNDYIITGIVYDSNYNLYLSDEEFNSIKESIGYSRFSNVKIIYFEFGKKNETLQLINDILSKDGYILSNHATSIYYGYLSLETFQETALLLSYVLLTLLVMMLIYFTSNLVKINKYNIGVLSSIGFSKRDLALIFGLENFKLLTISFLISLPLNFIIIRLINIKYKENLNVSINIIKNNYLSIFLVYIISLLFVLFIQIYTVRLLRKKDLINIIYN